MTDFATALDRAGLKQVHFRRAVERLSGEAMSQYTTAQWVAGRRQPPALAFAFLALLTSLPEEQRDALTR